MSIATLQDIIIKVRKLAGLGNSDQMPNNVIIDYINSFYLYDFPAEFRSLKLQDRYTFNTQTGIDTYPFDSEHYTSVQNPCYCAKRPIVLFYNPASFYAYYQQNINWQYMQNFATGNGTDGAISGVITNITQAANGVVTSAAHGLSTGNVIIISGVVGMTEVNGETFTITVIDANSFFLNVDTLAFTPYISDGSWTASAYQGQINGLTATSAAIVRSVNNNPIAETLTSSTANFRTSPSKPTFQENSINRIQNILITANVGLGITLNVTDDGAGNLIGDCTAGAIDYKTGVIANLTFNQAVPSGNNIQIQYLPINLNIPFSIMFYQNQFVLRPVPDKGYTIELQAYRMPSQALLGSLDPSVPNLTGTPELNEWWECVAVGASKKIYEDRLDMEGVAMMDKMLQERYQVCYTRTYAQLGQKRIQTIYADQLSNSTIGSGWGWGSAGN